MDIFKEYFKHYKNLKLDCLDNENTALLNKNCIYRPPEPTKIFNRRQLNESHFDECGLINLREWEAYDVVEKDGLIFIKNPFTPPGQRYWMTRCLRDYTKKPYRLNIDAHIKLESDWWNACENDEKLQKMLRWSTLGYHHDWDTKVYSEENKRDFPDDLSKLCKTIANACGFVDFNPQASIVNFYPMGSNMGGHTDHSEENLEAPLISISFGQSAIFLIGGETKETIPVPLYICSGDIVIMSGHSRLCFHAVPKIVKTSSKSWIDGNENDEWRDFDDFVSNSRINVNVRQVLNKNQTSLQNNR